MQDGNAPPGHEAGPQTRTEPLVDHVEAVRIACLQVLFREGVIDDREIRTTTCKSAAHTNGEHLAALGRIPLARCLGVGSNRHPRKDPLVLIGLHQVPHLPRHIDRKVRGV